MLVYLFSICYFIKEIEFVSPCFYGVIETLVKVWRNSKRRNTCPSVSYIPTTFLVLPKQCPTRVSITIQTWKMFSIF